MIAAARRISGENFQNKNEMETRKSKRFERQLPTAHDMWKEAVDYM